MNFHNIAKRSEREPMTGGNRPLIHTDTRVMGLIRIATAADGEGGDSKEV